MKRLLKYLFHTPLSFPSCIHPAPSSNNRLSRGLHRRLLQSALMMATFSGLMAPGRALAASLVWSNSTVVWPELPPVSTVQTYPVATANGGVVNVRLTWTGDTNTITRLDNNNGAQFPITGGFPNPGPNANSLASIFDPTAIGDEITVTIEFLGSNNNPIPAENVNFTIFDIDQDDSNVWQDEVTVNGSLGLNTVSPTLSIPPGSVTVSILGNVATGFAPAPNQEAGNLTGEGNLDVSYASAVDSVTYTYGNGPNSPSDPGNHGIALSNLNFDPAIIGLAKSAGTPVSNSDGSFTIPYTLTVENLGDTPLNNVQITEDLTTTFADANGFTVTNVQSANLTENTNFDGNATTDLLQGVDTLAPGANQTVTFDVIVIPGNPAADGLGPFENIAEATAFTSSGAPVTDTSTDNPNGDPDPDGNGDPGDNSTPTVVNLPGIGVAKQVTDVVDNGSNNFDVTYELIVENLGPVPLANVQVTEDLQPTFAGAASFNVTSITTGGAPLTANSSFNGATNQNLLTGTDTLAAGASQTITFVVNVDTGGNQGPYENTAIASGTNNGVTVTDQSDDGVDPDPNPNDGNPGGGIDENDPTPISLPDTAPIIGVAKRAANVVDNGDNIFDVTYELVVENLGPVPLQNVQVTENLVPTFAGAVNFDVTSVATGDPSLNANFPGFDGDNDQNLLVGTDTLAVGASQTITFVVRVDTGGNSGPFENTAIASGSNGSVTVTDESDDGTDPDPNPNDGNPGGGPNEDDPTVVSLVSTPFIGVAKRVANVADNDNNNFTVTYELVVENLGNVALQNVQVTENLVPTFDGAVSFNVTSVATGGAPLNANSGFDGDNDQNLLLGTDTLAAGASQTITFVVDVNTGGNSGPFENTAIASGSNGNVTVTDESDDGTDPDPNPNDGNPGGGPNEDDPTVVSLTSTPFIGVAKRVTNVVNNGNDTFDVTYELVVENLGNVPLENVQVTEDLTNTFAGVTSFSVTTPVLTGGPPLTPNPIFDGTTNFNLLAGTDTLPAGALQTITFVVNVSPGGNQGPFENIAFASGSNGGVTVTDQSDDGIDPDPNPDDGNPGGGPDENDPTIISPANIRLIKRITTVIEGDNPPTVFNEPVENPPNPSFVGQRVLDTVLSSGDVVEYTIYYLNDSSATASSVEICDPIPPPTDFVPDGYEVGEGIQFDPPEAASPVINLTNESDVDEGRFASPLTPLSSCPNDTAGNQGAVVVNVGNVAPGEFGFVRFWTSIP